MWLKIVIIIYFFLSSCSTEKESLKSSEIDQYLNKFFKNISYITNLKYGELIIKYDLLDIDARSNNCIISSTYLKIIKPDNLNRKQYEKYLNKLEEKIEYKISSSKWLSIIDDNIDEKIAQLKYINTLHKAQKTSKNQKPSFTNKSVFDLTGKNTDFNHITSELSKLAKIDKITSHVPIISPINSYVITSHFNLRKDPFTKKLKKHLGIDLQGAQNARIYASAKGIVSFTGVNGGYGNLVIIDHGGGYTTRYAHLNKIFTKKGQKVKIGDVIGTQGASGKTTGDHLHYEIRFKDQPLNPVKFLEANKSCI
ncbi:MAG: peptidoglycan DD-metalloendopeptidase family protein [Alphaproteobacteria bacterium]